MRPVPIRQAGYRVEISAQAWRQIGSLPSGVFTRIQNELIALAELADAEPHVATPNALTEELCAAVDDLLLAYTIEPDERVLVLLSVAKQLEEQR